jgi:hypothetical protein
LGLCRLRFLDRNIRLSHGTIRRLLNRRLLRTWRNGDPFVVGTEVKDPGVIVE